MKPFFFALSAGAALLLCGCNDQSTEALATTSGSGSEFRTPLLLNALAVLENLQQFDEAPALDQVTERLNQWARAQDLAIEWKPDPMIDSLPKNLRSGDWREKLADKSFDHDADGQFLEESTWLRDISNTARQGATDPLDVAQRLFDWTVRNVQLIAEPTNASVDQVRLLMRRFPSDIVLLGEGTPLQRAWVFMLLARQQHLDVVMLATQDPDHPNRPRPWLPALLHNGQLYLFDTRLGLPLPGKDGKGIATLADAASDESVLTQLHLDDNSHYPILKGDLETVTAQIEASPGYLSRRMKLLESQLVGVERVVLSTSPSELAGRLKDVPNLKGGVQLWPAPFDTLLLRQSEAEHADQRFKQEVARQYAPFKLPSFYGTKYYDPEPGARQKALDDMMAAGETRTGQSSFGDNVRRYRLLQNMSEAEVAKKVGMKEEDETSLENSGQAPNNDTVRRFADALGVKPQDLLEHDAGLKRPMKVTFPLWGGRLLQFRNDLHGERGAKHYYILARPGDEELPAVVNELAVNFTKANHQPPPPALMQTYAQSVVRRKQDATYWLGLISYEEGQYDTAADYFKKLTLDVWPNGPWTGGATYNLARTYEAIAKQDLVDAQKLEADGKAEEAKLKRADADKKLPEPIKIYEADQSPQRYGNRLRARQLKEEAQKSELPKDKT